MLLSLNLIFNYFLSSPKEEFMYRLAKMTTLSIASITVEHLVRSLII